MNIEAWTTLPRLLNTLSILGVNANYGTISYIPSGYAITFPLAGETRHILYYQHEFPSLEDRNVTRNKNSRALLNRIERQVPPECSHRCSY